MLALLALLFFAVAHSLLLSSWWEASLGEVYSQLLIGGLWFWVGLVLFRQPKSVSILDLAIIAGMLLATTEFVRGAYVYCATGSWPYMETFTTATKLEFTFFMNFVLAFVVATLCFGYRQKVSRLSRWVLLIAAFLILFVSLRAGARNGMIGLVYLILSMLFVYMVFEGVLLGWRKAMVLSAVVLMGVGGIATYAVEKDARNSIFISSAEAGWNYSTSKAWLRTESALPTISSGVTVDGSAYERLAWIHSGLDLISAKPLGYGYHRNALHFALEQAGYPNKVGHSHSGFIDLGLSLGVPGVALWIAFCGSLIFIGFQAFRQRRDVLGLVLMLITCGFLGRMVLESVFRDHMLHIFLFISAALLAEMSREQQEALHG
ncbi:O-antigen ligase family protein [Chromobacterium violaceum]|uniref:O-antigen ligase family protein n=1 Tax=Chromobacterium violaceum TaxID=536 RepID=UPI001CE149C6|nr:O-antigen ligase family protein [Chromobacterium violaceum]